MKELFIGVDDDWYFSFYKSKEWSDAQPGDTSFTVEMEMNNSIFLKMTEDESHLYDFQLDLRGGSISYTVDVSSMDCGCVAGAYLVDTNSDTCTQDALDSLNPACRSVDVM